MKAIEFTKEMKILAMSYNKDFTEETIALWYEQFKNIKKDNLHKAIKQIIITNKYMPSIAELLDGCKKENKKSKLITLEKMKLNGYFKNTTEYNKAIKWLEKDITPEWLLNDMKKYFINENKKLIGG